jgi:hypothetical protein
MVFFGKLPILEGPSWWSYASWIYNYLCNQYISPTKLCVRIRFRRGVLDTTLYDKVCQWLAADRCFFPGTPVSSTNETDRHEIIETLFKVALNTITITYFRSGAAIIVELSEWNASINLIIYQVHVDKTQYTMQILKGKHLIYNNFIRS